MIISTEIIESLLSDSCVTAFYYVRHLCDTDLVADLYSRFSRRAFSCRIDYVNNYVIINYITVLYTKTNRNFTNYREVDLNC